MRHTGSHNTLTAYPLLGWQKYFSWLINPLCKCQDKKIGQSYYQSDCCIFDIQVALKNGEWYGSHGIAWYDINIYQVLDEIRRLAIYNPQTMFYIYLGYDNHIFQKVDKEKFNELVDMVKKWAENISMTNGTKPFSNVHVAKSYIEKPWTILYITLVYKDKIIKDLFFERYWSMTWAKTKRKLIYRIPLVRLWHKKFKDEWEKEFNDSGKEYFITDFV